MMRNWALFACLIGISGLAFPVTAQIISDHGRVAISSTHFVHDEPDPLGSWRLCLREVSDPTKCVVVSNSPEAVELDTYSSWTAWADYYGSGNVMVYQSRQVTAYTNTADYCETMPSVSGVYVAWQSARIAAGGSPPHDWDIEVVDHLGKTVIWSFRATTDDMLPSIHADWVCFQSRHDPASTQPPHNPRIWCAEIGKQVYSVGTTAAWRRAPHAEGGKVAYEEWDSNRWTIKYNSLSDLGADGTLIEKIDELGCEALLQPRVGGGPTGRVILFSGRNCSAGQHPLFVAYLDRPEEVPVFIDELGWQVDDDEFLHEGRPPYDIDGLRVVYAKYDPHLGLSGAYQIRTYEVP